MVAVAVAAVAAGGAATGTAVVGAATEDTAIATREAPARATLSSLVDTLQPRMEARG